MNVGMIQADSFKSTQALKVKKLAGHVLEWLDGQGAAVVGLNEIHPTIVEKLMRVLETHGTPQTRNIQLARCESNSLLWRAPQ